MRVAHFTWMFGHEEAVFKVGTAFAHSRSQAGSCGCVWAMFGHVSTEFEEIFATLSNFKEKVDSLLYARHKKSVENVDWAWLICAEESEDGFISR